MFFGSVIRQLPREQLMYDHILIATDGSKLADHGVTRGLELAKAINAKVTVVTVTEAWRALEMVTEVKTGNPDPFTEFEAAAAEVAQKRLAAVKNAAEKMGLSCEFVHVADQHAAEGIASTAKAKGCDLIVIASHGRRGVRKAILGSVASEVITVSEVPILLVK